MGRRGPPPKPTALKLLEGTFRKDRANLAEPAAVQGTPSCPSHLGRLARVEWRRLMPLMRRMGTLSVADRAAIAAYCQAWQRWVQLERLVEQHGFTMVTDKGFVMARPEVMLATKQASLLRQLAGELGLTPASRSRVASSKPDAPPDAAEEMLFGARRSSHVSPPQARRFTSTRPRSEA